MAIDGHALPLCAELRNSLAYRSKQLLPMGKAGEHMLVGLEPHLCAKALLKQHAQPGKPALYLLRIRQNGTAGRRKLDAQLNGRAILPHQPRLAQSHLTEHAAQVGKGLSRTHRDCVAALLQPAQSARHMLGHRLPYRRKRAVKIENNN